MKSRFSLRTLSLASLIVVLVLCLPATNAGARASTDLPPADMFQLPWEQGAAWVAIDGLDNGTNRPLNGSHYYLSGGAIDFAPHNNMVVGENTSNAWVTAAAAGTVTETSSCHLKINHGNGWGTEYQFVGNLQVKTGDHVARNQRLAVVADGVRLRFCPPTIDPDVPHLHFMLRPNIRNAAFSGWVIGYNPLFNTTTFTKGGQSFGLFVPILNDPGTSTPAPTPSLPGTSTPTPGQGVPNTGTPTPEGGIPSTSTPGSGLNIVMRGPITLDTIYSGNVDAQHYEQWSLTITAPTYVTRGAVGTTPGLLPRLVVRDSNGGLYNNSTALAGGPLPAGNYTVLIQPQEGSGSYQVLLQKNTYGSPIPDGPSTTTVVSTSPLVGESSPVTINLNNIPAGGYTSAEFTCTYDPVVAEANNLAVTSLFGSDAAVAVNGPQNGMFIIAVAGTNGNKAFGTGPIIRDAAITFRLKGLRAGWTFVTCTARVSKGDNTLTAIPFTPAGLAVLPTGPVPTVTSTPGGLTATATVITVTATARATATGTLIVTSTPTPGQGSTTTATPTGSITATSTVTATATATPTRTASPPPTRTPTATSLPPGVGILSGKVLASKPVGVSLFNLNTSLAASVAAKPDGSFSLTAPAGTYAVLAVAAGFLSTSKSVTLTGGNTTTLPTTSLAAGDIDNNNVIDQFDALTIGMNYNAAVPAAADLNSDGTINVLDLELLARNYRKTGPLPWQ